MKDYMKPTLQIALAASNGGFASGSCTILGEEKDLILDIIGGENADKIFASTEPCEMAIDYEGYCKFTSAELGAGQVFNS